MKIQATFNNTVVAADVMFQKATTDHDETYFAYAELEERPRSNWMYADLDHFSESDQDVFIDLLPSIIRGLRKEHQSMAAAEFPQVIGVSLLLGSKDKEGKRCFNINLAT